MTHGERQLGPQRDGLGAEARRVPLVGREEALGRLGAALDRARRGQGGLVAIVGEAGLGKSRLLHELRGRPSEDPVTWLEAGNLGLDAEAAYGTFAAALASWGSLTLESLELRLAPLYGTEVGDATAVLARLLGLGPGPDASRRLERLDDEALRRLIFATVRRFFARLSLQGPVVLVLDDLHMADPSSLELLRHVLPLTTVRGLLVVVALQPGDHPAGRLVAEAEGVLGERLTTVRLTPLTASERAALLEGLLGAHHLPPPTVERLLERTGGNPLFLEEVVRGLVEDGELVRGPTGAFEQVRSVPLRVPGTVREAILRRVDRLGSDIANTVRVAAVVGRAVARRVVANLLQEDPGPAFARLEEADLMRGPRLTEEDAWVFVNATAHEAIYESALESWRREMHARTAATLESLFPGDEDESAVTIARHWLQAEAWDRARPHLLRAGARAGGVGADLEALGHYQQALAAGDRAGEAWDPEARAELELGIGEALFRQGSHREATRHLVDGLRLLGRPLPTTPIGRGLTILREILRQLLHRLVPRRRPRSRPGRALHLKVLDALGWMDMFVDQDRFLVDAVLLLNEAESEGQDEYVVRGLTSVGLILDILPLRFLADRTHRRAVALAEASGEPARVGGAFFGLGAHGVFTHHLHEGEAALQRAAEAWGEVGDLKRMGSALALYSSSTWIRGAYDVSGAACARVVQIGEETGDAQVLGWGLQSQGQIAWCRGELSSAIDLLRRAIGLFGKVPDVESVASAQGDLGLALLSAGRLDEALEVLEEASRTIREHAIRGMLCTQPFNGLADAYLRAWEAAGARDQQSWERKARRALGVVVRHARIGHDGEAHALRLRGTAAWLRGRRTEAVHWWQRSIEAARRRETPFPGAVTRLEMGIRLEDLAQVRAAEEALEALGANGEAARARAAAERLLAQGRGLVAGSRP